LARRPLGYTHDERRGPPYGRRYLPLEVDMEPNLNVLVVDDDPSIVEMIRLGLETDGMHVLGAGDGAEALDVLQHEPVDVILLDIMMPRVDGWMALMEIRTNPATADIPVIMLTAKTQDLAKILAFKQGVQQYVTKPFNILELSARVRSLVDTRELPPHTSQLHHQPELHQGDPARRGRLRGRRDRPRRDPHPGRAPRDPLLQGERRDLASGQAVNARRGGAGSGSAPSSSLQWTTRTR
jgi:CheY-like chemotaxis protein